VADAPLYAYGQAVNAAAGQAFSGTLSGQAVTLDASGSRHSGAPIGTFKWTVDGHQAANLFSVETSNGYRYSFSPDELSPCTLPQVEGSYPYTDHLGIGACGSVPLTLPGPVMVPLAHAYALYVDDSGSGSGAVFFGGGACLAISSGDCDNPPGTGIALGAEVAGAVGLSQGTPFDFEGDANVTAKYDGYTILAGQAQALVSHGPSDSGGIGVCGNVSLFDGNINGSGGFAYPWTESIGDFLSNALFKNQGVVFSTDPSQPACGLDWLNAQIGVNVQAQDHVIPMEGVAPAIEARVTGRGEHRRLVYTVRREPDETVLFYQVSAQVNSLLGTAHAGHGSIPFTATAGTGSRQVVAQVYIDGAPQARIVVGSYEEGSPLPSALSSSTGRHPDLHRPTTSPDQN
jgi:hypothetical protein